MTRSSNANEWRDAPIASGAHTAYGNDIGCTFEGAVFAPVFNDARCQRRTDAGQLRELRNGCCIEIEARIRLSGGKAGRCADGREKQQERKCERNGFHDDLVRTEKVSVGRAISAGIHCW